MKKNTKVISDIKTITKKPMKTLDEFKSFAFKGNIFDMAVGVIIGGAFGKIVSSLVSDVFMPLLSLITAGNNVKEWAITLNESTKMPIGIFLQNCIDFLLIAGSIFIVIKIMSSFKKKEETVVEEVVADPEPTTNEILLEIRDLLKK